MFFLLLLLSQIRFLSNSNSQNCHSPLAQKRRVRCIVRRRQTQKELSTMHHRRAIKTTATMTLSSYLSWRSSGSFFYSLEKAIARCYKSVIFIHGTRSSSCHSLESEIKENRPFHPDRSVEKTNGFAIEIFSFVLLLYTWRRRPSTCQPDSIVVLAGVRWMAGSGDSLSGTTKGHPLAPAPVVVVVKSPFEIGFVRPSALILGLTHFSFLL